eukprot:703369-Pelagomonas_calceolata.AAC.4
MVLEVAKMYRVCDMSKRAFDARSRQTWPFVRGLYAMPLIAAALRMIVSWTAWHRVQKMWRWISGAQSIAVCTSAAFPNMRGGANTDAAKKLGTMAFFKTTSWQFNPLFGTHMPMPFLTCTCLYFLSSICKVVLLIQAGAVFSFSPFQPRRTISLAALSHVGMVVGMLAPHFCKVESLLPVWYPNSTTDGTKAGQLIGSKNATLGGEGRCFSSSDCSGNDVRASLVSLGLSCSCRIAFKTT